ncbi:MAG: cell division ATP-binding protein FtsE [Clostridia bacterium]|nr:cell division ATP-binding protein FtsE [Clostridia bacterium]
MIEFSNVSKIYDTSSPVKVEALKNVSLKIGDGEFVYVIGPNGSGKSTLVKLLTAEERLTEGHLTFGGYQLEKIKRHRIPYLRRRIGMVFQDFRLIDTMTVYQNVAFALHVTNTPAKEIRRRVPKILDVLGLIDKAKCYPGELSGGEQQRVGIARALVGNPELIIADEPTGNIDPEMSYEILDILDQINKMGTTVIFVTHQREFLRTMPRRVVMLEQGRIIFDEDLSQAAKESEQIEHIEVEGSSDIDENQLPMTQYVDESTREFARPTQYEDGFVPPEN